MILLLTIILYYNVNVGMRNMHEMKMMPVGPLINTGN